MGHYLDTNLVNALTNFWVFFLPVILLNNCTDQFPTWLALLKHKN